jgi:hypothetical protein
VRMRVGCRPPDVFSTRWSFAQRRLATPGATTFGNLFLAWDAVQFGGAFTYILISGSGSGAAAVLVVLLE